jgi:cytochrome b pre-mRNA-processing protein 3
MDASLREMGAGDLGVGKRVQRMAAGFYGRVAAYDAAASEPALADALRRNLYGTVTVGEGRLAAMTGYLEAGRPEFPDPSTIDWHGGGERRP